MDTKKLIELNDQNYTILIVDDTPTNLSVITGYLEGYGFEVMIALSGERALQRIGYVRPDIILLDVRMSGIDGFETCRRLKANEATRNIPVIFLTSLTDAQHKVKGFEVGGVDYITKPLQEQEVLVRIMTHLRLQELTRSLREKNLQLEDKHQVEKAEFLEAISWQHKQLQALTKRLAELQEAERKQIAQELHDEIGQALTGISINLAAIEKEVPTESFPRARERLAEASLLADQTLEQIRELSLSLRPAMLDDLGLPPTLEWYVKQYAQRVNIKTELEINGLVQRLAPEAETALYRIVQEALTNVAKHAKASMVRLQIYGQASDVVLVIEDDGQGFEVDLVAGRAASEYGLGLIGIQERVTSLKGNFSIRTSPGQGTRLAIEIPWEADL